MTVLLIRKMAKELAGMFWSEADGGRLFSDTSEEHARSKAFRDTYPTIKDFMQGNQRCRADFAPMLDEEGNPPLGYFRVEHSDRWWKKDRPGWQHFVEKARTVLATRLRDPSMSEHEKHVVSEALIEDYNRSVRSQQAEKVNQRRMTARNQLD
jgi:hypothetical protein